MCLGRRVAERLARAAAEAAPRVGAGAGGDAVLAPLDAGLPVVPRHAGRGRRARAAAGHLLGVDAGREVPAAGGVAAAAVVVPADLAQGVGVLAQRLRRATPLMLVVQFALAAGVQDWFHDRAGRDRGARGGRRRRRAGIARARAPVAASPAAGTRSPPSPACSRRRCWSTCTRPGRARSCPRRRRGTPLRRRPDRSRRGCSCFGEYEQLFGIRLQVAGLVDAPRPRCRSAASTGRGLRRSC